MSLDKNSHVEALLTAYIKSRKKSLGKEKEKNSQRRKKLHFVKRNSFAESDKGSWFGQTPSTSSASAEDPKFSNTPGVLPFALPLASLPIIMSC